MKDRKVLCIFWSNTSHINYKFQKFYNLKHTYLYTYIDKSLTTRKYRIVYMCVSPDQTAWNCFKHKVLTYNIMLLQ